MADDTLALLSRTEAYRAINDGKTAVAQSDPERDAEFVAIWVPAISRRFDELCGPIVIRTVTDERHDGGGRIIDLLRSPADTVTMVVEYTAGTATTLTAEQDDTLPADGYLVERYGQATFLRRRQSGADARFAAGRRNVKVTYEAGRYADTDAVDPKFKLAASFVLQGVWNKLAGSWATGGDPFDTGEFSRQRMFDEVSHVVKRWLGDELRPPAVA